MADPIPFDIKPRQKAGAYTTFERRYGPTVNVEGGVLRGWDDPAVLNEANERLIWTIVDADGKMYVVPGYATVNFMGRVLCERPWSDGELASPGYVY